MANITGATARLEKLETLLISQLKLGRESTEIACTEDQITGSMWVSMLAQASLDGVQEALKALREEA